MSCIIEAEARKGLEPEAALVDLLLLRYCHREVLMLHSELKHLVENQFFLDN